MSIYSSMFRNRDHSPPGRELLDRAVPSAFAPFDNERMSSRYSFLPTDALFDRMELSGFRVVGAQEQRSRLPGGLPTRKHLLRFAQSDAFSSHPGDEHVEVCLINSHDGSSSYRLLAGVFRLACANDLVVGAMVEGFSVRHCHAEVILAAHLRFGQDGCPAWEPFRLLQARRFSTGCRSVWCRVGSGFLRLIGSGPGVPCLPDTEVRCFFTKGQKKVSTGARIRLESLPSGTVLMDRHQQQNGHCRGSYDWNCGWVGSVWGDTQVRMTVWPHQARGPWGGYFSSPAISSTLTARIIQMQTES